MPNSDGQSHNGIGDGRFGIGCPCNRRQFSVPDRPPVTGGVWKVELSVRPGFRLLSWGSGFSDVQLHFSEQPDSAPCHGVCRGGCTAQGERHPALNWPESSRLGLQPVLGVEFSCGVGGEWEETMQLILGLTVPGSNCSWVWLFFGPTDLKSRYSSAQAKPGSGCSRAQVYPQSKLALGSALPGSVRSWIRLFAPVVLRSELVLDQANPASRLVLDPAYPGSVCSQVQLILDPAYSQI